jgi:hypothetical protein
MARSTTASSEPRVSAETWRGTLGDLVGITIGRLRILAEDHFAVPLPE